MASTRSGETRAAPPPRGGAPGVKQIAYVLTCACVPPSNTRARLHFNPCTVTTRRLRAQRLKCGLAWRRDLVGSLHCVLLFVENRLVAVPPPPAPAPPPSQIPFQNLSHPPGWVACRARPCHLYFLILKTLWSRPYPTNPSFHMISFTLHLRPLFIICYTTFSAQICCESL